MLTAIAGVNDVINLFYFFKRIKIDRLKIFARGAALVKAVCIACIDHAYLPLLALALINQRIAKTAGK